MSCPGQRIRHVANFDKENVKEQTKLFHRFVQLSSVVEDPPEQISGYTQRSHVARLSGLIISNGFNKCPTIRCRWSRWYQIQVKVDNLVCNNCSRFVERIKYFKDKVFCLWSSGWIWSGLRLFSILIITESTLFDENGLGGWNINNGYIDVDDDDCDDNIDSDEYGEGDDRGTKTQNFPGSNFLRAKTFRTKCAKPFLTTSLKSAILPLTTLPKNA